MCAIPRSVVGLYRGRVRISVSVVHCVSVPETAQHPAWISGDQGCGRGCGGRMRIGEALGFLSRGCERWGRRPSPSTDMTLLPQSRRFPFYPFSPARLLSTPSSLLLPPLLQHPTTVVTILPPRRLSSRRPLSVLQHPPCYSPGGGRYRSPSDFRRRGSRDTCVRKYRSRSRPVRRDRVVPRRRRDDRVGNRWEIRGRCRWQSAIIHRRRGLAAGPRGIDDRHDRLVIRIHESRRDGGRSELAILESAVIHRPLDSSGDRRDCADSCSRISLEVGLKIGARVSLEMVSVRSAGSGVLWHPLEIEFPQVVIEVSSGSPRGQL